MQKFLLIGISISVLLTMSAFGTSQIQNTNQVSPSASVNTAKASTQAIDIKVSSAKLSDSKSVTEQMAEETKNLELENAIIKALVLTDDEAKETRYYYNYVDLNDDNSPEVFVQLIGPMTSGTGGDTGMIFRQKDNKFILFQQFSLIRNPLIISNEKTNGWHDIIMETYGGGEKAKWVQMKFNGKQYPNPNQAIEIKDGQKIKGIKIITNDIAADFQNGKGLYLKKSI